MALELQSVVLARRAMREWDMVVCNVVEEVNLVLVQQQACSDGMHGCIPPAFIEKATIVIKGVEVVGVGWATEPIEITDFKVRPLVFVSIGNKIGEPAYEVAMIVRVTAIITQEGHGIVLCDVLGMLFHEFFHAIPERRNRLDVLVQTQHETVLLLVLGHVAERIVVDIAKHLDARLDAPIPFVAVHDRMLEEKARLITAHVSVADGVAVDDLALRHILTNLAGLFLVDELWE
jgi:hypothetical protein